MAADFYSGLLDEARVYEYALISDEVAALAAYGPVSVTVTFHANGGVAADPASKPATVGQPYCALATTSRTGYAFAGWFTAAEGGEQVTADTVVTNASNHTLYAHWTALPYTAWVKGISNWPEGADTSPNGDPDNDDLPNLIEYAFGLSPVQSNAGAALLSVGTTTVQENGQPRTRATLPFTPATTDGLRFFIQATNDLLTDWSDLAEVTAQVAAGTTFTFTDTVNLDAPGTKRFLRLCVETNP